VIFISGAIPGDMVDVRLGKNKKDWAEGHAISLIAPSPDRLEPFCAHFGTCGGCKWQMLPYAKQLQYKQQEAEQNLRRIGKTDIPELLPIIGSDKTVHYRNKVEFTFSNKRYLTAAEINTEAAMVLQNALGYHAPRIFDKAIDIHTCHLMDEVNDRIRNTIRTLATEKGWTYYDAREHNGWLRNLVLRFTRTGELMLNVVINYEEETDRKILLDHLLQTIPEITTLLYTINPKWNDSLYDLTPQVYHGKGYVTEKLGDLSFIISPLSFFQTNTAQAEKLYEVTKNFAGLTGSETVYDLYCGTGSIGLFVSDKAQKIIGVEVVESAIEDAKKNAALNGIEHARFFAGDVIKICNSEFFAEHGHPDVVITDPPRAGMHEKLIQKLLEMEAPKIVYVSCNTATQARDIALLAEKYQVEKVQPVDMFPHTHHIECVALLTLKTLP
jgi:23S rRNA (uracil1939-C5)-methyltransferase